MRKNDGDTHTFELADSAPLTPEAQKLLEAITQYSICRTQHNSLCGCGQRAMDAAKKEFQPKDSSSPEANT